MFSRYHERSDVITKDPIDIALVEFFKVTKKYRDNIACLASDNNRQRKLYYLLDRKRQETWLELFPAIDNHPDWIYEFMSPFGTAYVRTVDEAVSICEKVEAFTDQKKCKRLKGKKLDEWRANKRRTILASLGPIKLGVGGGTIRL